MCRPLLYGQHQYSWHSPQREAGGTVATRHIQHRGVGRQLSHFDDGLEQLFRAGRVGLGGEITLWL